MKEERQFRRLSLGPHANYGVFFRQSCGLLTQDWLGVVRGPEWEAHPPREHRLLVPRVLQMVQGALVTLPQKGLLLWSR
jgi:hypothetical protein